MYKYDYNDEKFVFGSNTCSDNNYKNNNNNNSQRRPMEAPSSNPRHLHFILDPLGII